jgi:hypothetical protein
MKQITRREAIEAIKEMFETNTGQEDNVSRLFEEGNDNATFLLDKRKYERDEIVEKLSEYFKNASIIDGLCRITSTMFVFTTVKIEERSRRYDKREADKKKLMQAINGELAKDGLHMPTEEI